MVGFSKGGGGGEEQQSQSQARIAATIKEQVKNIVSQLVDSYSTEVSDLHISPSDKIMKDIHDIHVIIQNYYDTVLLIEDKVFTLVDHYYGEALLAYKEKNVGEQSEMLTEIWKAEIKSFRNLGIEDPNVTKILADGLEYLEEKIAHLKLTKQKVAHLESPKGKIAHSFPEEDITLPSWPTRMFTKHVIKKSAQNAKKRVEDLKRIAADALQGRAEEPRLHAKERVTLYRREAEEALQAEAKAVAKEDEISKRPVVYKVDRMHDRVFEQRDADLGGGRYHKKKSKRKSMRKFKSKRLSKKKPIRKIKSKRLSKKKPIRKIKSKRSKKT